MSRCGYWSISPAPWRALHPISLVCTRRWLVRCSIPLALNRNNGTLAALDAQLFPTCFACWNAPSHPNARRPCGIDAKFILLFKEYPFTHISLDPNAADSDLTKVDLSLQCNEQSMYRHHIPWFHIVYDIESLISREDMVRDRNGDGGKVKL
jgi:hypothetical protein